MDDRTTGTQAGDECSRLNNSIGYRFAQVGRTHRNAIQARLTALGLHTGQEIVIMALMEHDGQAQNQLAEALCVEPPTVAKMVARMERDGWLERRGDSDDGRVTRVFLTEKARALVPQIGAAWADVEMAMLVGVSEIEQALLRRVLHTMHSNLER